MCNLLVFDALGTFIGMRFDGYNRKRSLMGGFLTLFFVTVAIVTIAFFANIYLSGKEISQITNIQKFWDSQDISVGSTFQFAISNKYSGKPSKREDIWGIQAYYVNMNVFENKFNFSEVSKIQCNETKWQKANEQFNLLNLNEAFCFEVEGLNLSGNSNTEIFNYISIRYTLLVNLTDSQNQTEVRQLISQNTPFVSVYFLEGVFEITGKTSNPKNFINSKNINITYSNVKELDMSISEDELIINYDKLIVNDPVTYKDYVLAEALEKISVRDVYSQTNSLTINFIASKNKSVSTINFMTFSEMLARAGGIIQNIITFFFLMNYINNYWGFEINHFNTIFERIENDLKFEKEMKKIKAKFKISFTSLISEMDKNNINDINKAEEFNKNERIVYKVESESLNINNEFKKKKDFEQKESPELKKISPFSMIKSTSSQRNKILSQRLQINNESDNKINLDQVNQINSELSIFKNNKNDNFSIKKIKNYDSKSGNKAKYNLDLLFNDQEEVESAKNLSKRTNLKGKNLNKLSFSSYILNKYFDCCLKPQKFCYCESAHLQSKLYKLVDEYFNMSLEMKNYETQFFRNEILKYLILENEEIELFNRIPFIQGFKAIERMNSINVLEKENSLCKKILNIKKDEKNENINRKFLALFSGNI